MPTRFALALLLAAATAGCDAVAPQDAPAAPADTTSGLAGLVVPPGFTFATTRAVEVRLRALDTAGGPVAGAPVDIADAEGRRLATGVTAPDGTLALSLAVPTDLTALVARPRYIGLPAEVALDVRSGRAEATLGGVPPPRRQGARTAPTAARGMTLGTLGGWNALGVPDYLTPTRDPVDAGLLATVNASLPELAPVPSAHPQYLASGADTDVRLAEAADVWVTFVHEGAGWRNTLGYYTYDAARPPATAADIDTRTIVFPNVSLAGSGGGLYPGDKVHLGRFQAGTGIGWFLVSNGWTGSAVGAGSYTLYSNPAFNPEPPALRQHNVLLRDAARSLLLLAFEDVRRDAGGCDQDFNDAVFYVTSNPVAATAAVQAPAVTDPGRDPAADADRDGVLNALDAEPYDPTVASLLHVPAEGADATVAFEDLWPGRGDYDFNDLVADYHLTVGLDAAGRATRLDADVSVQAVGAGFRNGLALALPIPAASVRSVSGARLGRGVFTVGGAGVEAGQPRAVVPLFDDAYALVERPGGFFVNTQPEAPRVAPGRMSARITLAAPVLLSALRLDALDLFLVANGVRGREVHLPGRAPTARADAALFGTSADRTAPGTPRTYVTAEGLPWAIGLPEAFAYPRERAPLDTGHLRFAAWARSGGTASPDWYRDRPGHRDAAHLYAR